MTNLTFVVIAHIHTDSVGVIQKLIEIVGIDMYPFVGNIKTGILQAIGYDFVSHLNG